MFIIGQTWPEPDSTAAGYRMMQLVRCFLNAGYDICFASCSEESAHKGHLKSLGVNTETIRLNHGSFDLRVRELQPDLVLFDRFMSEEQFGWRVAKQCPRALRILDMEDLHSLRLSREQAHQSGVAFSTQDWLLHECTLRELASIFRSDISLVISPFEMQLLQEIAGIPVERLWYLPFLIEPLNHADFVPYDQRSGFIFVGNGRHRPNIDALQWLRQEIWPAVRRQLPQVELHIYGAYLPDKVNAMHEPRSGFLIKGRTENLRQVMEGANVQLAPLRFGAGIKGKLIDSMRFGTPSVTTPIGAEGMHGSMPWNGFVSDELEGFVRDAVRLYEEKDVWQQAQRQGAEIINRIYSKSLHEGKLLHRVAELRDELEPQRTRNVLGRMLLHHQMASVRYMSKWIEAKNS